MRNASQIDRHRRRSLRSLSVAERFPQVEPSNSEAQGAVRPILRNEIIYKPMVHNSPFRISVSEVRNFALPSYQTPLKSDYLH